MNIVTTENVRLVRNIACHPYSVARNISGMSGSHGPRTKIANKVHSVIVFDLSVYWLMCSCL